ncbi:peptide transporter family 1-like [Contarinia nasturtii]|uniref:peptide transporter family 1-like n=1 Tax=Contarinia nasturtii TaxID=265458 RepID=UPI0012D3B80C|nr:peptide transporter family 1-like [Contarinia nasturtii]
MESKQSEVMNERRYIAVNTDEVFKMPYAKNLDDDGGIQHDVDSMLLMDTGKKQQPELPYPRRVLSIILNEFGNRFNYLGVKTILVLYMTRKLDMDEDFVTVQYHIFTMVVYIMCVFGAILSDSWLGKFKATLYLSIINLMGNVCIAISAIPHEDIPTKLLLYLGLALMATGYGGIKPNVAAFAGDQFKLPEQAAQMEKTYSLLYFCVNIGALATTTMTPIIRSETHCFGDNECYSLAFGVPVILTTIAVVLFVAGKSSYTMNPPSGNMLVQVIKCTVNAITNKRRNGKVHGSVHFLDYSIEKYGQQLVDDTKCLLNILLLFLPLSMYWALAEQQYSRWIVQAMKMNGDLGFYHILPDQMLFLNPILLIICIPLFDYCFYPLLYKINFKTSLQKITAGGLSVAMAILISAIVEFRIESCAPNSLSILWQIPQYIILGMSEVMFYVTGLTFAYEQAPKSMKSVVQSFWLLTVAIGNAVIVVITELKLFESQVHEFLLYFCLMIVCMIIFICHAFRFRRLNSAQNLLKQDVP